MQTRHTPQNVSCHAIFANAVKRSLLVNALSLFPFTRLRRSCGSMRNGRAVRGNLKRRAYLCYSLPRRKVLRTSAPGFCGNKTSPHLMASHFTRSGSMMWPWRPAGCAMRAKTRFTKPCAGRTAMISILPGSLTPGYLPLRRFLLEHIDAVYPLLTKRHRLSFDPLSALCKEDSHRLSWHTGLRSFSCQNR